MVRPLQKQSRKLSRRLQVFPQTLDTTRGDRVGRNDQIGLFDEVFECPQIRAFWHHSSLTAGFTGYKPSTQCVTLPDIAQYLIFRNALTGRCEKTSSLPTYPRSLNAW